MAEKLDALPADISRSDSLPTLPTVALQILELTQSKSTTIEQLCDAIALDPALAAKLLKLSNSAYYSRGGETTTLRQASTRLGMKAVNLMALSFSLVDLAPEQDGTAFKLDEYWRHSLVSAVAGRSLVRLIKSPCAEEAFLGGLLGRLGQLVMARSISEKYAAVVDESKTTLPDARIERERLGYDFHQIGQCLMESWGLPRLFGDAVLHWPDPSGCPEDTPELCQTLARALHFADVTSSVICETRKGRSFRELHRVGLEYFGLTDDEIDEFVIGLEPAVAEAARLLEVELADRVGYTAVLDEAKQQMLELSIGAAMDLHETTSRTQQLEREKVELQTLASTDKLTGLSNRSGLDARLATVVSARARGQESNALGLLMIDVDRFKGFNDTFGHIVGDQVLSKVAVCLREATRNSDFVARYGGEEFVVILPNTTVEDLQTVAERIRRRVAEAKLEHAGRELSVTVSVGGACVRCVSNPDDGPALLELADECLYEAKDIGRNCSVCRDVVGTWSGACIRADD